jgi:cytochrome d ubiquinol oxidase subunit II
MAMVWSALVLLCLVMYLLLDGYDLGIGIGMLFERDAARRRDMLEHVALTWDGNETWLVLLGVSLWAGFPRAFGTILPHAYLAVIVMLFSLIVRGVAVEMASQAPPAPGWERAFALASLAAALAQGIAVATLVQNVTVASSGSAFGAIGWFSVPAALAVACLYLTLGYAYLKLKTAGDLRAAAGRHGVLAAALAAVLIGVSLATVDATAAPLNLHTAARAVGYAGLLLFATAGVVTTLVTMRPASRLDALPFAGTATAVVALVAAVVVTRAPVIVPPSVTITGSVSPGLTMTFLAVGVGLNMPLILFYNWFAHHGLGGKPDAAAASRDLTYAGAVDGHH